jgi:hypothetical protein
VTADAALTKERVQTEQKRDKFCKSLNPGEPKSRFEFFHHEDGTPYKRSKNGEHRLVIPRSLVREVITANHDPIFAAHPGQKRTFDAISLRYW